MNRSPSVDKNGLRKGRWSKEEDDKLRSYIKRYGHWNWREIPRFAGVSRCGKSCRLRWMNYLRPNIKHGNFTKKEEDLIMELHNKLGNKWAKIAAELPGRSDNEIKNHWHTHLKKRVKTDQNNPKNMYHKTENQTNFVNNMMQSLGIEEFEDLWASSSSSELSFATHEYACVTKSSPSPPPPQPLLVPSVTASSSLSSSASCSLSFELTSTMFMASDGLITTDDSTQTYVNENCCPDRSNNQQDLLDDGDFWTDPFFVDLDSFNMNVIMAPGDSDEFTWSTMDFYPQYHSQILI
ncbi:hypothetical protein R6Q57_020083 [Mikania cordata]